MQEMKTKNVVDTEHCHSLEKSLMHPLAHDLVKYVHCLKRFFEWNNIFCFNTYINNNCKGNNTETQQRTTAPRSPLEIGF